MGYKCLYCIGNVALGVHEQIAGDMSETELQTPPSSQKSKFLDPKANLKGLFRIILIVVAFVVALWLVVRFTAGEKAANRVTAEVFQRPIELKNSVENVPASSWKAFSITLPYTGTLTIDASVVKGNELDVYLMETPEIENVKAKKPFKYLAGFDGPKTKNFRRSARLNSGAYYIVFIDKTLDFSQPVHQT
jgi:hypothetical protein